MKRPSSVLKVLTALTLLVTAGASVRAGDVVEYVVLDGLGNVRVVEDEKGNVLERHDYLAFGEECTTGKCASNPGVGAGEPLKFTGKERDQETGLDYFGARYYRANTARFTTVDPSMTIQKNLLDPQRWNRYAYGRNNPLRFVDPDGRDWLFRAVMGQQYVQQYGDRSTFSVLFEGISGDIARAGPPFIEATRNQFATAAVIAGFLPGPREAPDAPTKGTNEPGQVTSRAGWRKQTPQGAWDNAEPGPTGGRLCPTCEKEVNVPPNSGKPRDWDLDHDPSWTNREFPPSATRKEVIENYQGGTRLECPACNRPRGNRDAQRQQ